VRVGMLWGGRGLHPPFYRSGLQQLVSQRLVLGGSVFNFFLFSRITYWRHADVILLFCFAY
jgi:hypothetical protein